MQEEVQILIQHVPEQQQEMAPEGVVDNLNLNANDILQAPVLQVNHLENFRHHEIPEDDLMLDAEEEDMENQQEMEN